MSKYLKVINGTISHANGFEYKINEVNIAQKWDPKANTPEEMGGFNFSTENKILRWVIRGDTLYDVKLPEDAEMIEVESISAPHGVFRSNKIIVSNPRKLTPDLVMDLYLKSDLPEKSYFQCLSFLSLRNFNNVCNYLYVQKKS